MSIPVNEMPLPYGWVKQFDPRASHDFYVDTKAKPPRSIWVHPFEDEQFLNEHPDVREKMVNRRPASSLEPPPPQYESRRHSYGGRSSTPEPAPAAASGSSKAPHKRGFLGKLKDKAVANMEEKQRRQQAMLEQQRMYGASQPSYAQQQYAAPQAAYPQGMGMGGMGMAGRRGGMGGMGGGMGGMALPLMGGLAGGLLLGDMMDGGFNNGGGFGDGGGGFDGGDFGGGGFGGGF